MTLSARTRWERHRTAQGLPVDVDACEACGFAPQGPARWVSGTGPIRESADEDIRAVCGLCAAVTILVGELAGRHGWHPAARKLRAGLLGAASAAIRDAKVESLPVSVGAPPSVGGGCSAGAESPSVPEAGIGRPVQEGVSLAELRGRLGAVR